MDATDNVKVEFPILSERRIGPHRPNTESAVDGFEIREVVLVVDPTQGHDVFGEGIDPLQYRPDPEPVGGMITKRPYGMVRHNLDVHDRGSNVRELNVAEFIPVDDEVEIVIAGPGNDPFDVADG